MHIVLIIIGGLLLLFGGGCALLMGALFAGSGFNTAEEYWTVFPMSMLTGIGIAVVGGLIVRAGIRKRQADLHSKDNPE